MKRAWLIAAVLIAIVLASAVAARMSVAQKGPAGDRSAPALADMVGIVKGYYADVTDGPDAAYARLAPGFQTRQEFDDSYSDVASIEATDFAAASDDRSVGVTVIATSRDGSITTFLGTISFDFDSSAGRWLIAGRNLKRISGPPLAVAASPTPAANIEPVTGSVDLVDLDGSTDLSYEISGEGNNALVSLRVVNKSDRTWTVHIDKGTRLDPASSSTQSMVVSEKDEVTVEPHDSQSLELQVDCLDIGKLPPASTDTSWRVTRSSTLTDFFNCIDAQITQGNWDGTTDRTAARQLIIWEARGSSRDDWIAHLRDIGEQDGAEERADTLIGETDPIVQECGSLMRG